MPNDTLPLEAILNYTPITGLMYETTMGLTDPLPEAFSGSVKEVPADEGRLMVRRGQRQTAKRTEYGAAPRNRELVSVGYKDMKLIHFFEEAGIKANLLLKLRDLTSYTNQSQGRDELKEQAMQFAMRFKNTEIVCRQQVLSKGFLYFDEDGNLLPSSSGAFFTYDFNVSANNKNQLNGIITASWATPSTDIVVQMNNLKKRAMRLTGLPLKYAFYGENIPSYLLSNTAMLQYFARFPVFRDKLSTTGILPEGLLGIDHWVPVFEGGFFEDASETNQDIWTGDSITFTPDPGQGDWWRNFRGGMSVPTSIDVAGEGAAVLDNIKIVHGMGGYGYVTKGHVRLIMAYFDTFLPALQNPDAVFLADVTP